VWVGAQVQALPWRSTASKRLNEAAKVVHVVAAVLMDLRGRILIAQRPPGSHLAGGWEFPGGKLESGECPLQALARELREELGIDMGGGPHRRLRRVRHSYPDREILIEVWIVRDYSGDPRGLDDQDIRWCRQEELAAAAMLPADAPIVDALRLPERLVQASTNDYTIGSRSSGRLAGAICGGAEAAVAAENAGADFIVMNDPLTCEQVRALCAMVSVPVFVCGMPLNTAWAMGASGINELPTSHQ